jgi:hypothetical protein
MYLLSTVVCDVTRLLCSAKNKRNILY